MAVSRKRTESLKITLTEDVRRHLDEVAEAIGQTPATVASVAVGVWVGQMKRSIGAQSEFFESLGKRMSGELIGEVRGLLGDLGHLHSPVPPGPAPQPRIKARA